MIYTTTVVVLLFILRGAKAPFFFVFILVTLKGFVIPTFEVFYTSGPVMS